MSAYLVNYFMIFPMYEIKCHFQMKNIQRYLALKKFIRLEEKVDISFKQFLLLKGLHGPHILSGSWCLSKCVEGGVNCLLFSSLCK